MWESVQSQVKYNWFKEQYASRMRKNVFDDLEAMMSSEGDFQHLSPVKLMGKDLLLQLKLNIKFLYAEMDCQLQEPWKTQLIYEYPLTNGIAIDATTTTTTTAKSCSCFILKVHGTPTEIMFIGSSELSVWKEFLKFMHKNLK